MAVRAMPVFGEFPDCAARVCCLLLSGCRGGRGCFSLRLRELLGQEAQQGTVDHEKEADLHGIAEEVLDEAAQEDGGGCLMIEDGQPERVEAQVDEDHDEEEGDTGAQQRDTPAVEEPAVDVAREKS